MGMCIPRWIVEGAEETEKEGGWGRSGVSGNCELATNRTRLERRVFWVAGSRGFAPIRGGPGGPTFLSFSTPGRTPARTETKTVRFLIFWGGRVSVVIGGIKAEDCCYVAVGWYRRGLFCFFFF